MLGTLDQREIELVLHRNFLGRLACRDGNEIYIVPVTYTYKSGVVTCHSFEGKKLQFMRNTPEVGFEVEEIFDHQHWKCVVARGLFEEIIDAAEIEEASVMLSDFRLKRKASLSAAPPSESSPGNVSLHGESVFYRIRLFNITGRYENTSV